MFNKFYSGITKTGNVPGGSLKGSLDNISRFLSTEPRIVGLDLSPAAPGLRQDGQNSRAVIFHMLLECLPQADTLGVAAPTTQASRPNASGRGLAPSRRYR